MREGKRINIDDILLILAVCLAPMTGLRIWKIGPGEILCLLFCLKNILSFRRIKKRDIYLRFWAGFLFSAFIGTIWGMVTYPTETISSDLIIWFYFAIISFGVNQIVSQKDYSEILRVLRLISYTATIWYLALYIYSLRISSVLLGAPLWYHGVRFTGGATNPHQIALLFCVEIVIYSWLIIQKHNSIWYRIVLVILLVVTTYLLQQTQSSTAIMAAVIGVAIVVWQDIWVKTRDKKGMFIIAVVLFVSLLISFVFVFNKVLLDWIESDSNGLDRIEIFKSFPAAIQKSPIFGLGPGVHAKNGSMEFHNTYLEICAMSGFLGSLFFVVFSYKLFRETLSDALSFGMMVSVYTFGFAGFGARRLVYWLIVVLVYELAIKGKDIRKVNTNKKDYKNE